LLTKKKQKNETAKYFSIFIVKKLHFVIYLARKTLKLIFRNYFELALNQKFTYSFDHIGECRFTSPKWWFLQR